MVDLDYQLECTQVFVSLHTRQEWIQDELARQPMARPRVPDLRGRLFVLVHARQRDRRHPRVIFADPLEDHAQHVRSTGRRYADGRFLRDRVPSHGLRGRVFG